MNRDGSIVLLAGFSTIMCIILLFCLYLVGQGNTKGHQEPSKFSIVDKYGKCEVVQYIPQSSSRSYYFLDCNK